MSRYLFSSIIRGGPGCKSSLPGLQNTGEYIAYDIWTSELAYRDYLGNFGDTWHTLSPSVLQSHRISLSNAEVTYMVLDEQLDWLYVEI